MALVAAQQIQIAGTAPTYNAASGGGDTVAASDRTHVHVKNGSGSSITLTITTPGTVAGLAIADATITVPAGAERIVGPLTSALFGDPVQLAWSSATSVTFAALTI